jgi:hypothetical protein
MCQKKERKKKYKYIFCASEKFLHKKKQFFMKRVPITKANWLTGTTAWRLRFIGLVVDMLFTGGVAVAVVVPNELEFVFDADWQEKKSDGKIL